MGDRHRVAITLGHAAGLVDETAIGDAGLWRQLDIVADTGFDELARDETRGIGAPFAEIFGAVSGRISLDGAIDLGLVERRVEIATSAVSNQNVGRASRAVVFLEGVEKLPGLSVHTRDQEARPVRGEQARPHRGQDLCIRVGEISAGKPK